MNCRGCDREFAPSRDWQEFCCAACRQRWHYLQRKQEAIEIADDEREDRRNGHTKQMNGGPREKKIDVVALLALATKPTKPISRRKIVTERREA